MRGKVGWRDEGGLTGIYYSRTYIVFALPLLLAVLSATTTYAYC